MITHCRAPRDPVRAKPLPYGGVRDRVFLVGIAVVHLHLLCDLVGSRGPSSEDVWPLEYLAPFSDAWTLAWSGQWALNAWPNVVFVVVLIGYGFARAIAAGESPVGLFGRRADAAFCATVQRRWSRLRKAETTDAP